MLTPAKITNHHFEASGRNAYKAESVDTFIREVAESYEQMFRENNLLNPDGKVDGKFRVFDGRKRRDV